MAEATSTLPYVTDPSTHTDALGQFVGTTQTQGAGGTTFSQDLGSGQTYQRYQPSIIAPAPVVSSDTSGIRNKVDEINKKSTDATGSAGTGDTGTKVNSGTDINSVLNKIPASITGLGAGTDTTGANMPDAGGIGTITPTDQTAITAAGQTAGAQYDPAIQQAQQAKEQGMASNIIRAGEAGGFMSTQFAGQSALTPAQGGTFVGQGGTLQQQQSAYDLNISSLQTQKAASISSAEAAKQDYIRTGKQADFDNAMKLYAEADTHQKNINDQMMAKANLALNVVKAQQEQTTFADQQAAAVAPGLIGKSPAEIAKYAADNNLDPNVLQGQVYQEMLKEQEQQTLNEKDNIDMISKTAIGGTVTINGKDYKVTGTNDAAPKTVDNGTEIYQQVLDPQTGKWKLVDTGIPSHNMSAYQSMQVLENIASITTKPGWDSDQNQVNLVNNLQRAFADQTGTPYTPITVSDGAGGAGGFIVDMSTATGAGAKNNNPGNLRDAQGNFIKYNTPEEGFQALLDDVNSKMSGGSTHTIPDGPDAGKKLDGNSTLEDMMRVYAPTADKNDPKGYAASIASAIGASPTDRLNQLDPQEIATQIAKYDSGTTVTPQALIMTKAPDKATGNKIDTRTGVTPNKTWDDAISLWLTGKSVQSYVGTMFGADKATKNQKSNYSNMIKNTSGAIAEATGIPSATAQAMYKANNKAATDVINRLARIETVNQTLIAQFPRLQELANKVDVQKAGITETDLNATSAEISRKFGSSDAANYIELIQTMRGDYSAMQSALAGSRGGLLFAQNAQDAIPMGLTADQYAGLQQTIQKSAENAQTATNNEANKLFNVSGNVPTFDNKSNSSLNEMDKAIKDRKLQGQDGYVSPVDYNKLKNVWVANGNNGDDFDNYYTFLKNPTNPNY